MPVYQYLCPKCNLEFELRQSFTDESVVVCPKCENGARRLFSPVPIIFKGSGFYVTDNAAKGEAQDSIREPEKEIKGEQNDTKEAKVEDKSGHDTHDTDGNE